MADRFPVIFPRVTPPGREYDHQVVPIVDKRLYRAVNDLINGKLDSATYGLTSGGVISVRTVLASTTVLATDGLLVTDATASSITLTLPLAATVRGREFEIKRIDGTANLVTLQPQAGETIDGSSSLILLHRYDAPLIVSDGALAWYVV